MYMKQTLHICMVHYWIKKYISNKESTNPLKPNYLARLSECNTRNVVPDKWNRFHLLKTCKVCYWCFIFVNCIIYFHGNGYFVIRVYNDSIWNWDFSFKAMLTLYIGIIIYFFRMDILLFLWLTMFCFQSCIKIVIYVFNAEILFGMYEKGMFVLLFWNKHIISCWNHSG